MIIISTYLKLTLVCLFALLIFPFSTRAVAEDCTAEKAPANFPYEEGKLSNTGKPVDFGIRPRGFVNLKSGEPTVHGIDVSKYQDETNFQKAYECGARFAYIRLSGGTVESNDDMYRLHWPNARSAHLMTGPYHNLSLLPIGAKKWLSAEGQEKDKIFSELVDTGVRSASQQASMFLKHLDELMSIEPVPDRFTKGPSPSYLPIALDLSYDPLPGAKPAEKILYGKIIAKMACGFLETIKRNDRTQNASVILFSSPSFYFDYRLNNSECGLNLLPVWLSYHSKDGDRPHFDHNSMDHEALNYLCKPENKQDRCIFQQYTAFGGFALYKEKSSLDLNRFFGKEENLKELLLTYK
jgi:hypothetical protein